MNKKFTMTLLGTAVVCMISTSSVFAATGKITGNSVRIREEASTDSSIVETVSKNTEVEVISEEGDFYKITYDNKDGYIHKDYVDVDLSEESDTKLDEETTESSESVDNTTENEEETEQTTSEEENNEANENTKIGDTINSDSNLYLMPTLSSSKIDSLKNNTRVKVEKTVSNWSYVTYKNKAGWIPNHKLLESTNNTEEDNKEETSDKKINKTAYLSASAANLREGPGTDYKSIGGIAENEVITVLEEKDGWYKVKTLDGAEGYVLKSLVTLDDVKGTSRSGERKIEIVDLNSLEEESKQQEKEEKKEETTKKENTSSSTSSSSSADKKRKELVAYAKKYLGYKYVSGGSSPKTGFDCSGFTKYVYGHFGYKLNRSSSAQANNGTYVKKSNLKVGDLLIFTGHVGIYIGNNKFIHASNPSDGVKITSLSDSYYVKNYKEARRIIK